MAPIGHRIDQSVPDKTPNAVESVIEDMLVPVIVDAIEIKLVVSPDVDVIISPSIEVARNNPPLKSANTPSKAVVIRTTFARIG